ncbi:putative prolyl aminopeptidase protein [Rosellinia necatrix]|uniref:Putative prolyl aminopeptidase protein n=1 Tax=Rosellinia necatrix TaxID=77044 RepID=A0A1W2TD45_ROSNE|nr:putative prolyl aminopeptidase protein [Rosellinia necatrix]
MPGDNPVLVLCPGAWCDSGYFRFTTDILTTAGYTCLPVSLPSVGSELRPKDAPPITHGLQTDANAVRDIVIPQLDAGNDVVLVCHSYGGVVTSEAVRGLDRASRGPGTGAVIHLVYVAAILLDIGGTVWPGGNPPDDHFIVEGDICRRNPEAPNTELWLAGCNEEQMALVASSLRSHAQKTFGDTVTYDGWRHIPGTYVIAKKDLMPNMIAAAPEGHKFEDIVEVDADHFAFCSAPVQVAEVIQKASQKAMGMNVS